MRAVNHTQLQPSTVRLAVVTETWPPEVNGVANTINRLVTGLHKRGDYTIELVRPRQQHNTPSTSPTNSSQYDEYLVTSMRLPFYREVRFGIPKYLGLKQHWRQQRPDIVQIVTEGPLGYAALKAAQHLEIPVISDFHTNFDQYSHYYGVSHLFKMAKRYLRYFHNQTYRTLVPTQEIRNQLAANGYHNLDIMARGIDADLFKPSRRSEALRNKIGVRPKQLLVTLVTRVAQEKNIDLAFQAFRAIQAQHPDARFLLVGDGPERKRLEQQYPDCYFAGMQTGPALAEHYASGDLFLYPSTSETFGNVVTEAMASGLPVVTFDYAAAREYIRHGNNGLVAPLDDSQAFIDAAVTLAADRALRHKLGQAACVTAHQLDWDKVVQGLHHTIHTVLKESKHEYETPAPTQ